MAERDVILLSLSRGRRRNGSFEKKWGYLGGQRLPEEVKKEVAKKVKNFPQFIIVNMKGKRTQVFIRWKKVSF